MKLIDASELKDFFFSETSGTEEIIHDLMQKHGLNYDNGVNEDAVMYFAIDLLKGAQNVIDTQPIAYDPDKVVEQLEEVLSLADKEKERCAREDPLQFDSAKGYATGIFNALEIVKAGGTDGN